MRQNNIKQAYFHLFSIKGSMMFVVLFLISIQAYTQPYLYEQYSIDKGLAHGEAYDLFQGDDYRIWVATEGGVSVYNGQSFKNYTTEDGLHSNDIKRLYEDIQGRVWVVHNKANINYIDSGFVHNVPVIDSITSGERIFGVSQGKDSILYFLTNKRLISYNGATARNVLELDANSNFSTISGYTQKGDTIFCTNKRRQIVMIDVKKGKLSTLGFHHSDKLQSANTYLYDNAGKMWIGGNYLAQLQKDSFIVVKELEASKYKNINQAKDGSLILSQEGGGFTTYQPKTGAITRYNQKTGFKSEYIYDGIEDHEGNLWLATYGQGVMKVRDRSIIHYHETNGLLSDEVKHIIKWNDYIWVATSKGLLKLDNEVIVDTFFYNIKCNHLTIKNTNELIVSTSKDVFIMDSTERISKSNLISGRMQTFAFGDSLFSHNGSSLYVNSRDPYYEIKTHNVREIVRLKSWLVARSLNHIIFIKNGIKVNQDDLGLDKFIEFRSMDFVSENEILLCSSNHFHLITYKNGKLECKHISLSAYPFLQGITSILIDGNALWVTVKNTIYKINKTSLLEKGEVDYVKFQANEQFLKTYFRDDGLLMSENGKLYCQSLGGLIIFDEKAYRKNTIPPVISFKEVKSGKDIINTKNIIQGKVFSFPPNQNSFQFDLQAVSYSNSPNIRYKHRLIGLSGHENWCEPTANERATFSYLPAGDYSFQFIADNGEGVWNENSISFDFTIAEVFWKQLWFWLVALIVLSGLGILLVNWFNTQKLKRQKAFSNNLLNEFEKERSRIAREIHDSVGQRITLLVRRAKSKGYTELSELASSALEETRAISHGLHPASLSQFGFKVAVIDFLEDIDSKMDFILNYEIDDVDEVLDKEQEVHLYRIIQESLTNIIKHASATEVNLKIKRNDNHIRIMIKDNGMGFDHNKTYQVKEGSTDSLGLRSIHERAGLIHASYTIKSEINNGTTVEIILKSKKRKNV